MRCMRLGRGARDLGLGTETRKSERSAALGRFSLGKGSSVARTLSASILPEPHAPSPAPSYPVVAAADFHKMPLLVQTGNGKSVDLREFPPARQPCELVGRIAAFHRKQSSAARAQVSRPLEEIFDGSDRTREHAIEALLRTIAFGPRVHGFDVRETEQCNDMIDELQLFRCRIDQREVPVGRDDRERKPGKPRTRTDIGNTRSLEVRVRRKTVEKV